MGLICRGRNWNGVETQTTSRLWFEVCSHIADRLFLKHTLQRRLNEQTNKRINRRIQIQLQFNLDSFVLHQPFLYNYNYKL